MIHYIDQIRNMYRIHIIQVSITHKTTISGSVKYCRFVSQILIFILNTIIGISMCNIRVCLTWTVQKNYLDLKCRVNFLIYTVEFTNNKREEQGFCIHPNPFPSCYTSNNDTIIMQNSTTNITYLRIHGHVDSHYNGEWACNHGTNRDSATINVTVLQSGN